MGHLLVLAFGFLIHQLMFDASSRILLSPGDRLWFQILDLANRNSGKNPLCYGDHSQCIPGT